MVELWSARVSEGGGIGAVAVGTGAEGCAAMREASFSSRLRSHCQFGERTNSAA